MNLLAVCVAILLVGSASDLPIDPELRIPLDRKIIVWNELAVDQSELRDSILTWLIDQGYWDARVVDTVGEPRFVLGPRYELRRLSIVTPNDTILLSQRQPFTNTAVAEAVGRYLDALQDRGWLYPRAVVDSLLIVDQVEALHAFVTIAPGPQVRLARLRIAGLTRTAEPLVRKYLRVTTDSVLSTEQLKRVERSARTLPFVTFVPPLAVRPRPGLTAADLELTFREQPTVDFGGGVGYLPNAPAELVWSVDAALRNLLGGGRVATVTSARREDNRTELRIGFSQPLFLLGTGEAQLRVETRDYRDDFYEFRLAAGYRSRLSPEVAVGLTGVFSRVEPATGPDRYRVLEIGGEVERDGRDDMISPRTGWRVAWGITYRNRRYLDLGSSSRTTDNVNETTTSLTVEAATPLVSRLIGWLRGRYAGLESAEPLPPLSALILVGGPGSLRGYRNDQFAVERYVSGSFDLRWRSSRAWLGPFYEAAYLRPPVRLSDGVSRDDRYVDAAGIALGLVGERQRLSLSLAWPLAEPSADPRLALDLRQAF